MYHHNHLYNIHVKNKIIIIVTKAMPTKDLHQYPGAEMIQQRLLKKNGGSGTEIMVFDVCKCFNLNSMTH